LSELLPTLQAARIRESLVDYLTTTFGLTDGDARDGLNRFLSDPATGMFKGPYVRLRLPFRPADPHWRNALEWYAGPPPYGHQAVAFARLASSADGKPRRPLPTLVTTGTGSGKTESFLYPILDHVLRARRQGVTGTKALILYPMNALANDQAARLTKLLTTHSELEGITAALYTGQKGPARTSVTEDGLITDREVIRDTAPDILLTNYKMLDQLLLRAEDQNLWRQSATSLRYLVLDEFHTYDGAQGTDVAMLLRRLGLALKSFWPADHPDIDDAARARPLGLMTPVATSATLGDKGDPTVMLDFAEAVFGERFASDAIVTETRLGIDEWIADAAESTRSAGLEPLAVEDVDLTDLANRLRHLGEEAPGADVAAHVLGAFYGVEPGRFAGASPEFLLAACKAHPFVQELARQAGNALALRDLADRMLARHGAGGERGQLVMSYVLAALGHVRTVAGRDALSVEVHFWIRELTRIDRVASATARFRWADDGPYGVDGDTDENRPAFPAIYCRYCGRSGWGVGLAPVGSSLAANDDDIRRNHAAREGRFRALLYAPGEAAIQLDEEEQHANLRWFSIRHRELLATVSEDDPELRDGWILPVLTNTAEDADEKSKKDTCPSCGQEDGIRFLGSAIATLLSVSLSTLFGARNLDAREKKALVFTDSVQDAAHRAGFVQARSHTLTLRSVLQQAVAEGQLALDALVEEVIRQAGDDRFARYRLLPPSLADRKSFVDFWQKEKLRRVPASVRTRVENRLKLDASLEFGLNSRTGRTLELTGAVTVEVQAGTAERMAALARAALSGTARQERLDDAGPSDEDLVRWVRGVLDRMRIQGAIDHPWFEPYRKHDGNDWWIRGGRPPRFRLGGMPAFPRDRPAPAYPKVGGKTSPGRGLDSVTSQQSWYARWTSRALRVSPLDGARLMRVLLDRLARDGVVTTLTSESGATVYAIPLSSVVVTPVADPEHQPAQTLVCDTCRATTPGSSDTIEQLAHGPCLNVRCRGRLGIEPIPSNFYQRLYQSPDMRRVVAREHTSLLDDATRLEYENGFRRVAEDPEAPNVLVATPTLEMGIDIGDLSTVFLASLPRTVASYLQRVGRAGRLTGNALDLAFVTGRGEQLPKLGDPLSVVDGEVRPPATYLAAEEILRRQFTAYLIDTLARDPQRPHPRTAAGAIGSYRPGTFLGDLVRYAEQGAEEHLQRFLGTFGGLPAEVTGDLREWLQPKNGPRTSGFAQHVQAASQRWQDTVETLKRRKARVEQLLPELEAKAKSPAATDADKQARRSAEATLKLVSGQLSRLGSDYWISVLEEYGLLPNYTLLDDSVTLDVGLSWIDPDTGKSQYDSAKFQRGSAHALREFAPGATFYARGMEITIDAVDLGLDGASIRTWVFCPDCGYTADVAETGEERPVQPCPRCGSRGIQDTAQRLDVVELTRVSAEVRSDESAITDRRDERNRPSFQVVAAADVDPAHAVRRWFVENSGLGCTYLRQVDIRWINLGPRGHTSTKVISRNERPGRLFRLCSGCGKKDVDAGRNRPHEHRPWCPHRDSESEVVRTVALSRTLRTQGLLIRLPRAVSVGDHFAVPSLSAALLLGLREQMGGHPDHINVEHVIDPTYSDGSDNHDALLLHDVVPGGTGYLADHADPERLREMLALAWNRVRNCECRHEDRLACHRCLLPFASPLETNRVSRSSAERHLRVLLALPENAETAEGTTWTVTEVAPREEPESHLEHAFYRMFVGRLRRSGATVTETPGPNGNIARFTFPGGRRQWTLTPQVNVADSRPDFLLQTTDMNVPDVAIFTDGRAYHATAACNRLADDAAKRANLRDAGLLVVSITMHDLKEEPVGPPAWYRPEVIAGLIDHPQLQAPPDAYKALGRGPLEWLVNWVESPDPDAVRKVARAVPMFLSRGAQPVRVAEDTELAEVARAALLGEPLPAGNRTVYLNRSGRLAVVVEMLPSFVVRVAVVLDDRDDVLDEDHADSWRAWLRLSNVMAARDWPTVVTTTSRIVPVDEAGVGDEAQPPRPVGAWADVYDQAAPGTERELVAELATRGLSKPPAVGVEGPDGIPLDLAWPDYRIAVAVTPMDERDRDDLHAAGWQVVEPSADKVATAVTNAMNDTIGER